MVLARNKMYLRAPRQSIWTSKWRYFRHNCSSSVISNWLRCIAMTSRQQRKLMWVIYVWNRL